MLTTDEKLLARVRSTEAHEAWQAFYEQYWNAILRYSRKLGLDERHSEDVLQESMVTLMRHFLNAACVPRWAVHAMR